MPMYDHGIILGKKYLCPPATKEKENIPFLK